MRRTHIELLAIGFVLILHVATPLKCFGNEVKVECKGKYKGGLKPSPAELAELLKQHDVWLKAGGLWYADLADDPRRANLCEANLQNAVLGKANLDGAKLSGANLGSAQLSGAHLMFASLSGADLSYADLTRAYLSTANLTGAFISGANLTSANLTGASLSGAFLSGANLGGANLSYADLTHTSLSAANLTGVFLIHARLNGANLPSANLRGVHLNYADLTRAYLSTANLTGAFISGANLTGANLTGASLSGAYLSGANLGGAQLSGADLTRAYLSTANLTSAYLNRAHLNSANLTRAQVSKARLDYATLTDAIYAPASEPPDPYVAGIKGLETINAARGEEIGLIQLRKLLQEAGLRDEAREATYSIQRNITRDQLSIRFPSPTRIGGILRVVGFEWTTAYGLYPERALRSILLLLAMVTPVYMFAMLRPTAESGIVKVFPAGRLDGTAGDPADEEKPKKQLVRAKRWRKALRTAAYFSLISAVNIGFEQFTPGDWIRRLQRSEYSLEAVGWVRVVAGVQALLSVYLLAMWVLTQFGQPFE